MRVLPTVINTLRPGCEQPLHVLNCRRVFCPEESFHADCSSDELIPADVVPVVDNLVALREVL